MLTEVPSGCVCSGRGYQHTPAFPARSSCRNIPTDTERVQLLSRAVKPQHTHTLQGGFLTQQEPHSSSSLPSWNAFHGVTLGISLFRPFRGCVTPTQRERREKQGTNIPANHRVNQRAAGGIQRIQPDTKQSWRPGQAASVHQEKASWELPEGFQSTLGNINCPFKQLLPRPRLQIKYYDNIL